MEFGPPSLLDHASFLVFDFSFGIALGVEFVPPSLQDHASFLVFVISFGVALGVEVCGKTGAVYSSLVVGVRVSVTLVVRAMQLMNIKCKN